jgi:hypothetical protein
MSDQQAPAAAIDIIKVLRASLGASYLPVDIKLIAPEISRLKFPNDPITKIQGEDLPGFEGMLKKIECAGKSEWRILYNNSVTPGRQNFTLAHEFAHYMLHRLKATDFECAQRDMLTWDATYGAMEAEANTFASFLLMPIDDFRDQLGGKISTDLLTFCAERYGVSFTAAAKKWLEFTPEKAALVVSRDDFMLWASVSDPALKNGIYYRTKGRTVPIPDTSLTARGIISNEGEMLPVGTWWPDRAVTEMTIFADKYDFKISLLVFHEKEFEH